MVIELNDLETKRFGIKAARLTDAFAALTEVQAAAKTHDIDMLTVRIGTDHVARVQALEDDGFRLMDTLVYYDRPLTDMTLPAALPANETIRQTTAQDAGAVADVAAAAFQGYIGHYHADPKLADDQADAAYVEWAHNSVLHAGPDTPAYVLERDAKIAAFLTTTIRPTGEGEIVLNGVHPKSQQSGLYSRLLDHGMFEMKKRSCTRAVVSTQVNNIAVQKAWARKGLRMSHSYYTLHKWA